MNQSIAESNKNYQTRTLECRTDIEEARKFLLHLAQEGDPVFTFQTFTDHKDASAEKKERLTRVLVGTIEKHFDALSRLNASGAGIFVTINKTKGNTRRAEDVVALRAAFVDKDDGRLPETLALPTSILVESARGNHGYWLLVPNQDLSRFKDAQKTLIDALETDHAVKDLPRVMRLPGFFHMKDPTNPFMVRVKSMSQALYTVDQLVSAFGKNKGEQCDIQVAIDAEFQNWARKLDIAESQSNFYGGRNCTLLLIAREGLAAGLTPQEILSSMRDYAERSGDETDVGRMLARQQTQHKKSPFRSILFKPGDTATDIAEQFLHKRKLVLLDGTRHLRFWRRDAYCYVPETGAWKKWDRGDFRSEVIKFLQADTKMRKRAKANFANDVIENIEALTIIPSNTLVPGFLNDDAGKDQFILMRNGILKLADFLAGKDVVLLPHTPDFFSTAALPFSYDARAGATTWEKFLNQMMPSKAAEELLQEWFGYCLIFDTSYHKFMLLIGEGANGKSVICVVLRSLLGGENVSAVALEQFNPIRTFPLAATYGKLANVMEEIGEMNKAEEGVLKNFVSGGQFTVERKHRDPFEFYPTARLTFASNVLPRFSDRSDGLWRRLLPIVLTKQVIDESKQDKRLVSPEFWLQSGELSGILNWALEGLRRLRKRGHFVLPLESKDALNRYKDEANPARLFLDETCLESPGARASSRELYVRYHQWMEDHGMKPLGEIQFSREVKRRFPNVCQSQNAHRIGRERSRVWEGLDWQGDLGPVKPCVAELTNSPQVDHY